MIRETVHALLACAVTFAICAVAYPLAVFGVGHTLFPSQARGSLIERDGKVVGSVLIAQPFASDRYFSPRPSAAGSGYAADAASGSNLGSTNPALHDRIAIDAARLVASRTSNADLKANLDRLDALQTDLKGKKEIKEPTPADTAAIEKIEADAASAQTTVLDRAGDLGKTTDVQVPVDLVTTSGAGLDPDISPEAARYQAPRVAAARGVPVDRIMKRIEAQIIHSGAIIGAPPRVNVLLLNLDLDKEIPAPASTATAEVPATKPEPAASTMGPKPTAPVATTSAEQVVERAAPAPVVEALTGRIDRLQEKLDATPVESLTADVKDLKTRLAKYAEANEPATKQLAALDEKVAGFGREIRSLRAESSSAKVSRPDTEIAAIDKQVQALKAQVESILASSKKEAATAQVVPVSATKLDLSPATKLFRDRRYAEALTAFRELTVAHPEDARPWYFAALANGLSTGQWRGETEELVKKGVDRERSAAPTTPEIDAAFAGLTKETGKDWLLFYRRQVSH